MLGFYRLVIPALWIIWLIYWGISAIGVKPVARHEHFRSRLTHHLALIIGAVILGVPGILGPTMEQRFHPQKLAWFWIAVALVAIGLSFSIAARAWLGTNWSGAVTVKEDHELIRSGPYAIVRHPIYTGMLLALIGSALAIDRWRALIGLVLMIASLVRKLTIEERFMSAQFGDAYARYRAEVPGLIPFVL